MNDVILKKAKVALEPEVSEGTLVLPSAAGSFIAITEDSVNDLIKPSKEMLERANITANIDSDVSRSGMKSVSGSIKAEFKAGVNAALPELGLLVQSALGGSSASTGDLAVSGTPTSTNLPMTSTTGLAVGDIVAVKSAAGEVIHVSPISALVTNTSITLLVAYSTAFANTVLVSKMQDYKAANSGHPSFSLTKYMEDAVRTTAAGCKVSKMAISDWKTGAIPMFAFDYEGMAYTHTLNAPAYTPAPDTSLPPISLNACVYVDGTAVGVDELTIALENKLGWKTTTCSSNGRLGSRITSRKIAGTINPYMQSDSIANFTKWDTNTTFSLFAWAGNPSTVAGEYTNVIAIYLPKCQVVDVTNKDKDGLVQEVVSFETKNHDTLPVMKIAYK